MINDKNLQEKSDEDLVKLALENRDDFLYLVNRYKNKLYGYIRKITNISAEDGEDILQDIFLKVYLNLNDFDADLKFSSWIFRITHNEVISAYRKSQARPQHSAEPLDETVAESIAADFNIIKKIDDSLLQKKVSAVLDRLKNDCREIIILKFLEEKSYQEISDIFKKPMGTVASMMNRAKKEFLEQYKIYERNK